MQYVKQILGALQKLGVAIHPGVLALIAVGLPLLFVAYKVYAKRKQAAKGEEPAAAGAGDAKKSMPRASQVPRDRFARIWRSFLSELSWPVRRALGQFQPFLVLGPPGSGKSRLVDLGTDWRRQSKQYLASVTEDPDLQIYLGSRALALELSGAVLGDVSPGGRRALLRLFRPAFERRRPVVVVALDAIALGSASPDTLRSLGDLLRGKIKLLQEVRPERIEVRVVLTRLDAVEGFEAFSRFAEKGRVPTVLRIDQGEVAEHQLEGQLLEGLGQFDSYLSLALTTLDATEYRQVVAFLREAPRHVTPVVTFLEALLAPDGMSKAPLLEGVYLGGTGPRTPFGSPIPELTDAPPDPLRFHRVAALAGALALIAYLAAGYYLEQSIWQTALPPGDLAYERLSSPRQAEVRRRVLAFEARGGELPHLLFPSFFRSAHGRLSAELARTIRKEVLEPRLAEVQHTESAHRRTLYLAGLWYGSADNRLGCLIGTGELQGRGEACREVSGEQRQGNLQHWTEATGVDRSTIEDYLLLARFGTPEPLTLGKLPPLVPSPVNDGHDWRSFFSRLSDTLERGFVSSSVLSELQADAIRLHDALDQVSRFTQASRVQGLLRDRLKDEARQETQLAALLARPFEDPLPVGYADAQRWLKRVRDEDLGPPRSSAHRLAELCRRLGFILGTSGAGEREGEAFLGRVLRQLSVSIDGSRGEGVQFGDKILREADWQRVVRRSKVREEILAFLQPAEKRESIFFGPDDRPPELATGTWAGGSALVSTKASIHGRYTAAAFNQYVRPSLVDLHALLEHPDLGEERTVLSAFVLRETERYAEAYVKELDAFYSAFRISAASQESIAFLLGELAGPTSPLLNLVRVTAAQSSVDVGDANVGSFEPMRRRLAKYEKIAAVAATPEGRAAEVESFKNLLGQMAAAVTEKQEGGKGEGDKAAGASLYGQPLKERLGPSGRIALTLFREEEGSYAALTEAWLDGVQIRDPALRKPFLAPVQVLYGVGAKEIREVVREHWQYAMRASLADVVASFPFDRTVRREVGPEELSALFHPVTGKFHELRRLVVDPVSEEQNGVFAARSGRWGALGLPLEMYEVINRVGRLTRALWDDGNKPRPLEITVSTLPFGLSDDPRRQITRTFLRAGDNTLFNFNQQPTLKSLQNDWTQLTPAGVGAELTGSPGEAPPRPSVGVPASYWSLLRVLNDGARDGSTFTWSCPLAGGRVVEVRFMVAGDPWEIFQLLKAQTTMAGAGRWGR